MRKLIVALCFVLLLGFTISFHAETKYTVNGNALQEMSIEELYELEDAIVTALNDVFALTSEGASEHDLIGMYVVNPRTKKFHYPYCYSALQIGPDRLFVFGSASELAEKYKPCGQCKPYVE